MSHGRIQALNGYLHVVHQEWVVEIGQLWPEEALGLRRGIKTAFDEQTAQHGMNAHFGSNSTGGRVIRCFERLEIPIVLHYMSLDFVKLYNFSDV